MSIRSRSFFNSILLAVCILTSSCQKNEQSKGETYLYVADDFSVVAVESAPKLSESTANDRFVIIELDKQQQLPAKPRKVSGQIGLEDGRLVFTPDNSFTTGKTYRAIFQFDGKKLERDFYVRSLNAKSVAHVVNIYPSQPYLIQNLKRIYIEFSHPMTPGYARKNINFISEYGDTVRNVFKDITAEKWLQNGKLLRLDLDPIPYVKGPSWQDSLNKRFKFSQQYMLVIENEMRDTKGRKLTNDYQKRLTAYHPYMSQAGNFGLIYTPKANEVDSVRLNAFRAHDILGLRDFVQITDKDGNVIVGEMEIQDYESSLIFTPKAPWEAEEYHLRVSSQLEDIAGNTRWYDMEALAMLSQLELSSDTHDYLIVLRFWPADGKRDSRNIFQGH